MPRLMVMHVDMRDSFMFDCFALLRNAMPRPNVQWYVCAQIAVLKETAGKGTFCSLVMAVVVVKDILVFCCFAVNLELSTVVRACCPQRTRAFPSCCMQSATTALTHTSACLPPGYKPATPIHRPDARYADRRHVQHDLFHTYLARL